MRPNLPINDNEDEGSEGEEEGKAQVSARVHNGEVRVVSGVYSGENVTYFQSCRVEEMDTNPNVEVADIFRSGKSTNRKGLFAKQGLQRGDVLGIPVTLVLLESHVCLLSKQERAHLREATHSFKVLVVEALREAGRQGLYAISPDEDLERLKVYVTGVHAPRLGDMYDFAQGSNDYYGASTSYAEEPDDNEPNAVFSLALAQPVMLVAVQEGTEIRISYGDTEYHRPTWKTSVDKCREFEEAMNSKNLEAACRCMAKNSKSGVRAAVLECLVYAVERTWKLLHRALVLLAVPFGRAKTYAREVWEETLQHLVSKAKKRREGMSRYLEDQDAGADADLASSQLKLTVDTIDGVKRTNTEVGVMMSLPEGATSRELIVHPTMRYVLAKDVSKCTEKANVTVVSELHAARAVMLNELMVPVFTKWKCKEVGQAATAWLMALLPPFMRQDPATKKSLEVMHKALVRTGARARVTEGLVAGEEQLVVGLGVAMLAGFTLDASLASLGFMDGSSKVTDYILPEYVPYAEFFEAHDTNHRLLAACMVKWENWNSGESASRDRRLPKPTMWGLHVCNSLIVEGYLSMMYLTGTLGTPGYIIKKLVALWLLGGDEDDLCSNPSKWKRWLTKKLQALENVLVDEGVVDYTTSSVLEKNSEQLIGAHFYPGRGPTTCQDVKVLNTDLMLRFWDIVKKGQRAGGYRVNDMCQHYKMATKRAGERDDQLLKTGVILENAAEMVYDEGLLYASVDLVVKGIIPTKANVEAYKEKAKGVLDVVVGTNRDARNIAVVLNGGVTGIALVGNPGPLTGARRILAGGPAGQADPKPVKMRDVKKGPSSVWITKYNAVLAKTVFQTVGKDMSGTEQYPKGTLYDSLVSVDARAAKRWNRPRLLNAVKEWYQSSCEDDGTATWEEAYGTQLWVDLWSQECQAGAPIEDRTEHAKGKSTTKGNTEVAGGSTSKHTHSCMYT